MEKVTLPKILVIGENSLIGSTLLNYVKNNFELYSTHFHSKRNEKNYLYSFNTIGRANFFYESRRKNDKSKIEYLIWRNSY